MGYETSESRCRRQGAIALLNLSFATLCFTVLAGTFVGIYQAFILSANQLHFVNRLRNHDDRQLSMTGWWEPCVWHLPY